MGSRSIHEVPRDAFGYVWDNAAEPALEIASGDVVELHARDASDEQIGPDSTAADLANIDFTHVNPVSGPVFVKGARPGDVLAVELLELRPSGWGWTAIFPASACSPTSSPIRGCASRRSTLRVPRANGAS